LQKGSNINLACSVSQPINQTRLYMSDTLALL